MNNCMQSTAETRDQDMPLASLNATLDTFQYHGLEKSAELSLMNRYDTKYLLSHAALLDFIDSLRQDYSVLSINNKCLMQYRNIYFDTPDFGFYLQHHNKRKCRSKIRFRTYLDSATSFLELKNKNNKDMTDKHRVPAAEQQLENLLPAAIAQSHGSKEVQSQGLVPTVGIYYHRISFQSRKHNERLSIDLALRAERLSSKIQFKLDGLAIVELKQARLNRDSPVSASMRKLGYRPQSFSKYCVACASLFPEKLKSNSFKPILSHISPHIAMTKGALINV